MSHQIHGYFLYIYILFGNMKKYTKITISALFGIAIWLFWWLAYPQALGLQEQNQLFLFTWDYLAERLSVAGGLADWISEFIVQFYYIPWLGALLLAGVFVLIQRLLWKVSEALRAGQDEWYPLSFIPSLLLLVHMGDHDVLLSYGVALVLVLLACLIYVHLPNHGTYEMLAVPVLYWLAGPVMWVFVIVTILVSIVREGLKPATLMFAGLGVAFGVGWVVLARYTLLTQYPPKSIIWGINYYRMPLVLPALQVIIPLVTALLPVIIASLPKAVHPIMTSSILGVILVGATSLGVCKSFDKDTYEIIAYDQLVRQEQWDKVIKRAEKYQPKSDIGCVAVNLSLFMSNRIEDMFDFYQCGTRGLLMPRVRDYISNVATGEAFWRLGMVNSALRYAFDTQESTINNRKSGRAMKRIAECQIVNGRYQVASKYLDILKHSLFYRGWALDHERFLGDEESIAADPIYNYLRTVKFEDDFLYLYDEMDKMLAILYNQNHSNVMAGYYFMAYRQLAEQGGAQ